MSKKKTKKERITIQVNLILLQLELNELHETKQFIGGFRTNNNNEWYIPYIYISQFVSKTFHEKFLPNVLTATETTARSDQNGRICTPNGNIQFCCTFYEIVDEHYQRYCTQSMQTNVAAVARLWNSAEEIKSDGDLCGFFACMRIVTVQRNAKNSFKSNLKQIEI